jgi:hypothetical protein
MKIISQNIEKSNSHLSCLLPHVIHRRCDGKLNNGLDHLLQFGGAHAPLQNCLEQGESSCLSRGVRLDVALGVQKQKPQLLLADIVVLNLSHQHSNSLLNMVAKY